MKSNDGGDSTVGGEDVCWPGHRPQATGLRPGRGIKTNLGKIVMVAGLVRGKGAGGLCPYMEIRDTT